jgi:multidrug transporter EmrE-like cation transporter
MHMSLVQWLAPISIAALEGVILVVLTKRNLRRDLRFFCAYLAFNICGFLFLAFAVQGSPIRYFYSFWSVTAIGMLLCFAVLYEAFVSTLKPFSAVIDLAKMLFGWAALFLLISAGLTAAATSGAHTSKICAAVLLMDRSVQLLQCGLLLFLMIFEKRFGLSWRSPGMAVALGLGIQASVGLSASYIREHVPAWAPTVEILDPMLRAGVLVFWVVILMLPESEKRTAEDSPKRLILQRWDEALTSHGYGRTAGASGTVESFLPGIEKTVDRVLARKAML